MSGDVNKALAAMGATVIPFDVTSPTASDALKGVDVLITTIGGRALSLQSQAVEAAAKAGVKLFVPASWGDRIWERDGLWQRGQQAAHAAADKAGIKTAAFFCGYWPEWLVESPSRGWNLDGGVIHVLGGGEAKISFTSKSDTARYVVHALTMFSREKLEGGEFYIEGQSIVRLLPTIVTFAFLTLLLFQSLLELAHAIQASASNPLEIIVTGRQHLVDRLATNQYDVAASLSLGADHGLSDHHKFVAKLDNELWPEWNPKSAVEVLVAMLPK
jgi:hypothetical protein